MNRPVSPFGSDVRNWPRATSRMSVFMPFLMEAIADPGQQTTQPDLTRSNGMIDAAASCPSDFIAASTAAPVGQISFFLFAQRPAWSRPPAAKKSPRVKSNLPSLFKSIETSGHSDRNFLISFFQKLWFIAASSARPEGRIANVTIRWAERCGGREGVVRGFRSQGGFFVSDRQRAGRATPGPPSIAFDRWRDKPV